MDERKRPGITYPDSSSSAPIPAQLEAREVRQDVVLMLAKLLYRLGVFELPVELQHTVGIETRQ